jgi:hypothetical protein
MPRLSRLYVQTRTLSPTARVSNSRSFEDQVEHAKQLRRFGPSLELEESEKVCIRISQHKSGTGVEICMDTSHALLSQSAIADTQECHDVLS